MIRRRLFLTLALSVPVAARADSSPTTPITAFNDGLLKIMRAGQGQPFSARANILTPLVEQAFNLPLILQNSVGPRWTSFSSASKTQLLEVFTQFTVASWVANFDSFDGQQFKVAPDIRAVGNDQVVQTQIVPRSGDPTKLDYVMRQIDGSWKAVDILLDGSISRVAVQRSDFRSLVNGDDPSPLVAMLRDKATALSNGAKS